LQATDLFITAAGRKRSSTVLRPCNVIVYEDTPKSTVVSAMASLAALGIVGDNPELVAAYPA